MIYTCFFYSVLNIHGGLFYVLCPEPFGKGVELFFSCIFRYHQ